MENETTNRKAQIFLCVVLACIVLFVGGVCGFIGSRNKKLALSETEAGKQIETTEKAKSGADDKALSLKGGKSKAEKELTAPAETSTEKPSETAENESETETESTTEEEKNKKSGSIFNPTLITPDESNWKLTLINSNYVLPEDYVPDLVYVCGSAEQLDKKVAPHYEEMYNAALEEGIKLTPCSGYRSYSLQKRNYENKTAYYENQGYSHEDALVQAATIIMPPGSSEHNLGYAMDIVCVDTWFEDTPEFKWLNENAADYGFILRYPEDKTDITKVTYEPWHWRYVGVKDAKAIKESGQVLEQYLGE